MKLVPTILTGVGMVCLGASLYYTHKLANKVDELEKQQQVNLETIDLLAVTVSKKFDNNETLKEVV